MRTAKNENRPSAKDLRQRAEKQLKSKSSEASFRLTGEEAQRLAHELEVHQIELEMQNAELRQARNEVENALASYTDLYDFAPVGYFSLDRSAVISGVNLTGAKLLNAERSRLIGRNFGQFITEKYRPDFTAFLETVFASQGKESCEVALLKKGGLSHFVQLEARSLIRSRVAASP